MKNFSLILLFKISLALSSFGTGAYFCSNFFTEDIYDVRMKQRIDAEFYKATRQSLDAYVTRQEINKFKREGEQILNSCKRFLPF